MRTCNARPLTLIPLAAALLAACGAPDQLPELRGEVCDFRYRTLGAVEVTTERETLRGGWSGWRHQEPRGCNTDGPIHRLRNGSAYRFAEGDLYHTTPDGETVRLADARWPPLTGVAFRTSWPRTRIQGTVMDEGPLHAYGVTSDGALWDIRLSESGSVLRARAVDRLPEGWKPLAIDAPAGLRVVILASNGDLARLFPYRVR